MPASDRFVPDIPCSFSILGPQSPTVHNYYMIRGGKHPKRIASLQVILTGIVLKGNYWNFCAIRELEASPNGWFIHTQTSGLALR